MKRSFPADWHSQTLSLGTRRNEEKERRCVVVLTVRISHAVSRWCSAFAGGPSGRGVFLPRHRGEPLCFVRKGFQPNGAAFGSLTTPRINICLKETPCGAELTLFTPSPSWRPHDAP